MKITQGRSLLVRVALMGACALGLAPWAQAQHYQQTNLVSDQAGATTLDGNLVNAWGLSRGSGTPWWVANNGTGTSTLYNGAGTPFPPGTPLIVTIPSAQDGQTGVPTGTVVNGTPDFKLPNGNPARFIFVTEDGLIVGWNGGTQAVIAAKDPEAVYKGVAMATRRGLNYLYAANFGEGRIDVFDSAFMPVHMEGFRRFSFRDFRLPHGYAPFNVQNIGGLLYVTFAKKQAGSDDEAHGPGFGFVAVFSPGGEFLRQLEHGPWLNAPWGLALAPGDFGRFSHNLLVGQFGSGEIAVYNVTTGAFIGELRDTSDQILKIDGLWALGFGNGGNAGPLNTLFFTAGPVDESHGLFGTLTALTAELTQGNGN